MWPYKQVTSFEIRFPMTSAKIMSLSDDYTLPCTHHSVWGHIIIVHALSRSLIIRFLVRGRESIKPRTPRGERGVVEAGGFPSYTNWFMREATTGPSILHPVKKRNPIWRRTPPTSRNYHREEEEEDEVMEEIKHYHDDDDGDLLTKSNSNLHRSSTDVGPSTNDTQFVCSNWVSHISVKRLKYLTHRFYLPAAILKHDPNDRPHILPPRMVAFSQAVIWGGASLLLHPFLVEVLEYFNITLFSIRTPLLPHYGGVLHHLHEGRHRRTFSGGVRLCILH